MSLLKQENSPNQQQTISKCIFHLSCFKTIIKKKVIKSFFLFMFLMF